MKTPHEIHWKATKRILRYVHGTVQFGIHYSSGGTPLLVGFTDSDWADDPDDQKSTAGYVFSLGSGPVTWAYKKQQAIALSSAEAEYRATVNASQEALWLRQILSEFGFEQQHPTSLWCDNQSAIKLTKDPVQHHATSTSSYTCTSSKRSFMIKLLKCSFSLQKIKLQTFSQSLLQKRSFPNFDLC
jgi:hypothetical protein